MSKINQLITAWPPNTIATSDWLEKQGVYRQLADVYVNSGWMERVGRGAYKRTGETVSWAGGLYALQQLKQLPVHVGGVTSLELQGYGHFISPRITKCHLYSTKTVRLPKWFLTGNWQSEIHLHRSTLFGSSTTGIEKFTLNQLPIIQSTPERAILEMLSHVHSESSFMHAWRIMEGLSTLRPKLLQPLLEQCASIKVVRLCLYMAHKGQHPWVNQLDPLKMNLGSGKRSIVEGGALNRQYQITVPRELENDVWT